MPRLRKTLPRDFEEQLTTKSVDEIRAVLEGCELDARGGYRKSTALAFRDLPDELVRWLVERGLDVDAPDQYNERPLVARCHRNQDPTILIELGAQIGRPGEEKQPLFALLYRPKMVRLLIDAGADPLALDRAGRGLIENALTYASNLDLPRLAETVKILLAKGAPIPEDAAARVTRLGENLEFARPNFDVDSIAEVSAAMDELYAIFDVPPVRPRVLHDGTSRIDVGIDDPDARYHALFDLLVPASGSALTVQGEAIRLTGKLRSEIFRNGGANWNLGFGQLADALGGFLASGTAVGDPDELRGLIGRARYSTVDDATLDALRRWASDWVAANPDPMPLPPQSYDL